MDAELKTVPELDAEFLWGAEEARCNDLLECLMSKCAPILKAMPVQPQPSDFRVCVELCWRAAKTIVLMLREGPVTAEQLENALNRFAEAIARETMREHLS